MSTAKHNHDGCLSRNGFSLGSRRLQTEATVNVPLTHSSCLSCFYFSSSLSPIALPSCLLTHHRMRSSALFYIYYHNLDRIKGPKAIVSLDHRLHVPKQTFSIRSLFSRGYVTKWKNIIWGCHSVVGLREWLWLIIWKGRCGWSNEKIWKTLKQ